MLLCTSVPVFAQTIVESGTIIVVYYTDDTIYVAADSHRTGSNPDNKACKITKLGDHAFFTMTGRILPDAVEQAKKAFVEMPTHDIRKVAEQWAKIMKESYTTVAEKDPVTFAYLNPPMWKVVTGIFGSSAGNRLEIYDCQHQPLSQPESPGRGQFHSQFFDFHLWTNAPNLGYLLRLT
jgi:hypothetical protein